MKVKSKKSQMEAIGITLIVVLVLIGVLFGIQFVLKQKPVSVGSDFKRGQLAANFLSTLADTSSADCNGLSFSQIAQYCVRGTIINGCVDICDKAKAMAQDIVGYTLEEWNMNYNLTAKKGNLDIPITNPSTNGRAIGCPLAKQTKTYSIPVSGGGVIIMQLDLC